IYSRDADSYFLPASNTKLLTTAAVLSQLGADFKIRTSVYGEGGANILNRLTLVGKGDPSLTKQELENLTKQLQEQGITRIKQLIVDNSYFEDAGIYPSWEWEDVYAYYGVAINSVILEENAVVLRIFPQELGKKVKLEWSDYLAAKQWQVTNQAITAPDDTPYNIKITGELGKPTLYIRGELAKNTEVDTWGLAILDPNQYMLDKFSAILEQAGIRVDSQAVAKSAKQNLGKQLAYIDSPSLIELVKRTNLESNNLFAEVLLQILKQELNAENHIAALTESLKKLGVEPETYQLVDGSGLSRHNLITNRAIVQTLQHMANTPLGEIYRDSLPIAAKSGTLRRRFKNTQAEAIVKAKTGTLTGVSALSGYINPPQFQPLVFSILLNNADISVQQQREAIDSIVVLLMDLENCF
ncbi:MAG: D-alanyl-D-alanine carboxypeptidase/D-alanyl-D-alanine-endopeptidase, partial [Cyanobacteria bacterium J083]